MEKIKKFARDNWTRMLMLLLISASAVCIMLDIVKYFNISKSYSPYIVIIPLGLGICMKIFYARKEKMGQIENIVFVLCMAIVEYFFLIMKNKVDVVFQVKILIYILTSGSVLLFFVRKEISMSDKHEVNEEQKSDKKIFSLYYINTDKVYEIAMLLNNKIITGGTRENETESSVDIKTSLGINSNLSYLEAIKATEFQRKAMSWMYRGKEIFKPLNTGWIDENVACVREWVANIFFYRKGDTTIMVDAGYNYDRLAEKMGWLGIDPKSIHHILITHQDTDHVGAVEADSPGLFRNAKLYIGEIENRYLTGEVRRKVIYHLYKLPQVTINNEKVLLHDGRVLDIDGIKIECFLVPGHTWGHMVYLVDGKYLFTGDILWFGADGGYSFISSLAEDNKLAVKSLALLEKKLRKRGLHPLFITGHTGWTDNMEFAFAHKNELCSPFKKRAHDPNALYDAYDESDDTEENAKSGFLKGVGR